MKILPLIICFLIIICGVTVVADSAVATQKLSEPVRRVLARQVSSLLVASGLQPVLIVSHLPQDMAQHHIGKLEDSLVSAFAADTSIMSGFLNMLLGEHEPVSGAGDFAERVHTLLGETVSAYVHEQALDWRWYEAVANLGEEEKKERIVDVAESVSIFNVKFRKADGNTNLFDLYSRLDEYYKEVVTSDDLKQKISDAAEFYHTFPQLDLRFQSDKIDALLAYVGDGDRTWGEIDNRIMTIMISAANNTYDSADMMERRVTMADIFANNMPTDILDEVTDEIAGMFEIDKFEIDKDVVNEVAGYIGSSFFSDLPGTVLGKQYELNVTFAQLLDGRFLLNVTTQFLLDIGWSWQEFGTIVYPHAKQKASRLITDYVRNPFDVEFSAIIENSLRAEMHRNGEKSGIIARFVAELPLLFGKEILLKTAIYAQNSGQITRDSDMRKLFMEANENYLNTMIRWNYLFTSDLHADDLPPTTLEVIRKLQSIDVAETQIRERIFGPVVFNKIIAGGIYSEQDINAVRTRMSMEEISALVDELRFRLSDREHSALTTAITHLPKIMQIEGFARKFANGVSSNANLIKVLEGVEANSMYKPLADEILSASAGMAKRKRKVFLNNIIRVIHTVNADLARERLNYLNARGEEQDRLSELPNRFADQHGPLAERNTAIDMEPEQQDLPVVLPAPPKHEPRTPKKAKADKLIDMETQLRIEEEQRHAAEQKIQAEQGAKRQQQQLTQLVRKIGRDGLPADTPIWLRLQALLSYMEITVAELAERADLRKMQERFLAVVARDATVLPSKEELHAIGLALRKYTQKRKNRGELTPKRAAKLLAELYPELDKIERFLEI